MIPPQLLKLKSAIIWASSFLLLKVAAYTFLSFIPSPLILYLILGPYFVLTWGIISIFRKSVSTNQYSSLHIFVSALLYLSPFLVNYTFDYYKTPVKLCAYSDTVMGSTELEFYVDKRFRYVSSSIFGDEVHWGEYTMSGDHIYIKYNKESSMNLVTELELIDGYLYGMSNNRYYITETATISW
ncbi:MAG: hypothetical protein MK212_04175 [Saprospiraceae bacterium]|nr:hypothetical protein [Saprospiraceae bacterium]